MMYPKRAFFFEKKSFCDMIPNSMETNDRAVPQGPSILLGHTNRPTDPSPPTPPQPSLEQESETS